MRKAEASKDELFELHLSDLPTPMQCYLSSYTFKVFYYILCDT